MTSQFQTYGLSLAIYKPAISVGVSYVPRGVYLASYSREMDTWSHNDKAVGGWDRGSFTFRTNEFGYSDWLEGGLNRHVELLDQAGDTVFEGFVNKVSSSYGRLSVSVGPLMATANRVSVMYAPIIDPDEDPPIIGATQSTTIAEDTVIQARYGIIEKVLSIGQALDDDAEQIRDTYLAENKDADTSQSFNNVNSNVPTITIEVLGYQHRLDYIYNQTTTITSTTIGAKVQDVMEADPNKLFSTDYNGIEANGLLVPSYENSNRTARQVLVSLVSRGDVNENRYFFAVRHGRIMLYEAIPTSIAYTQQTTDPSGDIFQTGGPRVLPWRVKAGKWLRFVDYIPGLSTQPTLQSDPRVAFIEEASYSLPYGLVISGGKSEKLSQKMAQLGLGGSPA